MNPDRYRFSERPENFWPNARCPIPVLLELSAVVSFLDATPPSRTPRVTREGSATAAGNTAERRVRCAVGPVTAVRDERRGSH